MEAEEIGSKLIKFVDIDWETDGENPDDLDLPSEVYMRVPLDEDVFEVGADMLSDEFGWLVNHFECIAVDEGLTSMLDKFKIIDLSSQREEW